MHCKSSRQVSQVIVVQRVRTNQETQRRTTLISKSSPGIHRGIYTLVQFLTNGVGVVREYVQHGAGSRRWLKRLLLCLPLLAASCAAAQQNEAAALPLTDALPASWVALRDVQEVNIDGDGATEYLLFFIYDPIGGTAPSTSRFFFRNTPQPRGPIGAVIYDAQVITGTTTSERVSPDRPTNALVPYAILPSYRRGAGQGFIAEPAQSDAVAAYPVSYRALGQVVGTTTSAAADTLVFLGGETYLTFAWWQTRADGYGVTQLYAPGGFESALYSGFNWEAWRDNPQPIQQIIGVHPLHDRNLLCRRFRYDLDRATSGASGPPADGRSIRYQRSDLGLYFCDGTPAHPFYPEGVVLAYLLAGNVALLDSPDAPAGALPWLQELVTNDKIVRVDDLVSYATLTPAAPVNGAPPDTMTVCALVTLQPATDTADSNTQTQGLLFTLRHQPAGFQPPTSDQLFIQTVETIAAPVGGGVVNCTELLGG